MIRAWKDSRMPGLVIQYYPKQELYEVYVHGDLCERSAPHSRYNGNVDAEVRNYLDKLYVQTVLIKAGKNAINKMFGLGDDMQSM